MQKLKRGEIKTERKDYDKTPSSSSPGFKRRISLRQLGRFTDFLTTNSSRFTMTQLAVWHTHTHTHTLEDCSGKPNEVGFSGDMFSRPHLVTQVADMLRRRVKADD